MRDTVNICVFAVRVAVAQCHHCKWDLESADGEREFTETDTPLETGRVVRCPNCNGRNRIGLPPVGQVLNGGTRAAIEAARYLAKSSKDP